MMGFKGKQFIKVAEEIDKKYKSENYTKDCSWTILLWLFLNR